jgi:hypothetical protein
MVICLVVGGAHDTNRTNITHCISCHTDGDEQESQWKNGERHGKSIFRATNGEVEYTMYEQGEAKGTGVCWNASRQTAHKTVDGKKESEISLAMAEKLARDIFDLGVPEPSEVKAPPASPPKRGLLGRLFRHPRVDADGNPRFKDHGDWGTYFGEVDGSGKRSGKGKMIYDSGGYFDGFFNNNVYDKKGVYKWADGDEYDGEWADGECGVVAFPFVVSSYTDHLQFYTDRSKANVTARGSFARLVDL